MRITAIIAATFVGLAIAAAVGWYAAEAHYQGCVQAAKSLPDHRSQRDVLRGDDSYAQAVSKRVNGCSRLP
jgi:hypothetical protein